tara:strand:- start:6 stop:254 length:249 start_codon:yes stop_codon:yes gene_type:complete
MSIEGTHTVVVGNWLVDVEISHYNPGSLPDMRHDSTDPGEAGDIDFIVLSAAAVQRSLGGDMDCLNDSEVEDAIVEQIIICH